MVTVKQSQFTIAITWIIVNTLLMLVGAAVMVAGFLVAFSPEGLCFLYRNDMREALAEIYTPTLATRCINFGEILGWEVKIVVIVFGFLLFVFGLFAVATAVWPRAGALGIYIAIMSLIIIILMAVLIVYFIAMDTSNSYTATDWVRDQVNDTFVSSYFGDDSFDDFTRFVNFIHRRFNCCGIDGLQSFIATENWERSYTLPTVNRSEVVLQMNNLPMSCCARDHLKECVSDVQAKRLSSSWVMLGCFEGEMAADAENAAKYLAISLSIFTILLAFSITLAFIICTPLLASRNRGPGDLKTETYESTNDGLTTAETSPGGPPLPPALPYLPPRPSSEPRRPTPPQQPIFVEDSVTRWHSQFGSRFYDNQIFKTYNGKSTNDDNNRQPEQVRTSNNNGSHHNGSGRHTSVNR